MSSTSISGEASPSSADFEHSSNALLRSVSRSFYLTIRVLPASLRAPIGLAYLLARASDTIADSATASAETRLGHLSAFQAMVRDGSAEGLPLLQQEITPPDASEQQLIRRLPECLRVLAGLDEPARQEIISVLEKITHGQSLDLQRFPAAAGPNIIALQTAAELEEYTYLVAGCVGEFWTRLCFQRLPHYSQTDPAELCRIGINYGKGLQLVNILRDLPADLRTGRCYLPEEELRKSGLAPADLVQNPKSVRDVFYHWHARATELLDDGRQYITALRPARLRVGCFLPWILGIKTLELLQKTSPLESPARLKVSRSIVRQALLLAPLVAVSNLPLRKAN